MTRELKFRYFADSKRWYIDLYGNTEAEFARHMIYEMGNHTPLMQFTGLLDQEGKEVYEGDIVLLPDTESEHVDVGVGMVKVAEQDAPVIAKVIWNGQSFIFEVLQEGEDWSEGMCPFTATSYSDPETGFIDKIEGLKILGNVYQNPELLGTS